MNRQAAVDASAQRIPIDQVRPDPRQPRTYFRKASLEALAKSIKSVGQRTPIEVRALPAGQKHRFEIIDGERRWRACQLIGQKTIRICVELQEIDHPRQHFLSVVSNFHREGHTHMEISAALQYQVDCSKSTIGFVADLAESLGKSDQWVYNYLRLQHLAPKLQEKMHPETKEHELLRFNEAIVLASLPAAEQHGVYKQLLSTPRSARLKRARELAEKITGNPRIGKPRDIRIGFERFVVRLQADMDKIMDLKQSEFAGVLGKLPKPDLQVFRESLSGARDHLKLLLDATDRELKGSRA